MPGVNEQKMKLVGILTWVIVGIPSVLWEAEYRSLFAPRAAMLFVAFIAFIIAFIIGTRPGCTNAIRIRATSAVPRQAADTANAYAREVLNNLEATATRVLEAIGEGKQQLESS